MPLTTYLSQKLLQEAFGAVDYTAPTTVYYGVSSTNPTAAGTGVTEPSGNGYGRIAVTNNTTDFPLGATPSGGGAIVSNGGSSSFPTSTGAWLGGAQIAYLTAYDAASGGNLLAYGALNNPQAVTGSGGTITVEASDLTVSIVPIS